jgi:hypothetical protein
MTSTFSWFFDATPWQDVKHLDASSDSSRALRASVLHIQLWVLVGDPALKELGHKNLLICVNISQ